LEMESKMFPLVVCGLVIGADQVWWHCTKYV
jgi:hypothetical protein